MGVSRPSRAGPLPPRLVVCGGTRSWGSRPGLYAVAPSGLRFEDLWRSLAASLRDHRGKLVSGASHLSCLYDLLHGIDANPSPAVACHQFRRSKSAYRRGPLE
jgi:hypothetical protein